MKKVPFHGILAVGNTKHEATNNYRLLALGKGVTAFRDQDSSLSFVSNASSLTEVFNPVTGNLDIVTDQDLVKTMEFQSNSSDATVEANYVVCSSGCHSHIVYDSAELVKFCPVCTTALSSDGEEAAPGEDEEDEDPMSILNEIEDDTGEDDSESESEEISESGDDEFDSEDDESDEEEESEDDEEPEDEIDDADDSSSESSGVVVAFADSREDAIRDFMAQMPAVESGASLEVNYVVCSNADCGQHIVHNDSNLHTCPVCESSVDEPSETDDMDIDLDEDASTPAADSDEGESEDDLDLGMDDESEDTSESSNLTAVASTKKRAIEKFVALLPKESTSSTDSIDANYAHCSDCGSHVVSEKTTHLCPVCASDLDQDAEGEDDMGEDDLTLGSLDGEDEGSSAEDAGSEDAGDEAEGDDEESTSGEGKDCSSDEKPEELIDTEVDAFDAFDDKVEGSDKQLDVSYSTSVAGKPQWTAFFKGAPVAVAREADAGKNADLFNTPAFGQAVVASAKHIGVKQVLNEMGFKPFMHKVSLSAFVDRKVAEQVKAQREAIASTQSEYQERYNAALATAAIGINRGFFTGQTNPLKASLCASLESIGVKNPGILVDNVFRTSYEQFQKAAHAKALEILSKPTDVQESLSKTVLEMNYQSSESSSNKTVEDKLSSLGTSVSSNQQPMITARPVQESTSANSDFSRDLSIAIGTLGKR